MLTVVLVCAFTVVLGPWYMFLLMLLVSVLAYRRELQDIRADEKAAVFDATWVAKAPPEVAPDLSGFRKLKNPFGR